MRTRSIFYFKSLKWIAAATALILCIAGWGSTVSAQLVSKATGGGNISADRHVDGDGNYVVLTGPTITETAPGQLVQGDTIKLTPPAGFEWNPNAAVDYTKSGIAANNTKLEFGTISVQANAISLQVTKESTSSGSGQGPGKVVFSGIEVRPTDYQMPNSGIITNDGTTGPAGNTNYGELGMVPGARAAINVETQSDGSGSPVQTQDIVAGRSLTVYAVSRDQFDNFKKNINVGETGWQLINITGGLAQSDLTAAATARRATFSSNSTGAAQIEASLNEGNANPSGTITVIPAGTDHLTLTQQPSSQATAGQAFAQQPVLEVRDRYDNTVTDDDTRNVTASATADGIALYGTQTITPSNGVISFTDLNIQKTGSTTLTFQSSGLDDVQSNSITINPAAATDLEYLVQPSNTAKGATITPAVELQLMDQYGNDVPVQGTTVDISQVGSGALASTSYSATTNSNGVASFSNIDIDPGAPTGGIRLEAAISSGSEPPVESDEFLVQNADALARFEITDTNGDPLGSQTAGQAFDVRITARDGAGNVEDTYEDPVTISSSNGTLASGGGNTVSFTAGTLSSHTLSITSAGDIEVKATHPTDSRIFGKTTVTVDPAGPFNDSTTVSADPAKITADGISTSSITVQLKDEYGNNLQTGNNGTITIETSAGELDNGTIVGQSVEAIDNGDGTYSVTLRSATKIGTATLSVYRDGTLIHDSQTVQFTAGELADFIIRAPDSAAISEQRAGVGFNVDIWAVDKNDNKINSYSGSLTISSNVGGLTSGGSASLSGGHLSSHPLTINEADSAVVLSVTEENQVIGQSGSFVIESDVADPATSIVRASPNLIQNDGISTSEISVILRDQFNNRVYRGRKTDLSLNISTDSGNPPGASYGSLSFNQSRGIYTSTLTSSTTVELVIIEAALSGSTINDSAQVDIVIPNTWTNGGKKKNNGDWNIPANWDPAEIPTSEDFVVIPDQNQGFPEIDEDINIGSLDIKSGANITFMSSQTFTVQNDATVNGEWGVRQPSNIYINGSLKGSGNFITDFTSGNHVTEVKGDFSINSYTGSATNAILRLNGDVEQTLEAYELNVYELQIRSDVVNRINNPVVDNLSIASNSTYSFPAGRQDTLDVTSISGNGRLDLNDNRMLVRGNIDVQDLGTKNAKINFIDNTASPSKQTIENFQEVGELVVNNSADVRVFSTNNMTVHSELILKNGSLELPSGVNLVCDNITTNGGSIRALRNVASPKGWRQMASPVTTTFGDFLDSTVTQGFTGASLTSDTLQSNVLWYKEDATGTDNQRWRAPADATNNLTDGRGYFVYFFGNITNDSRYTDPLPHMLNVEGTNGEDFLSNTTYDFGVTYTPKTTADTVGSVAGDGWNLVGNPYFATIDWDDSGNWTKTNVDNVIYIWSPTDGEYKDWNGSSGSLNDGLIAPFQGFWVKASSSGPTLSVNKSAKTLGRAFVNKSRKDKQEPGFKLQLAGRDTTEMNFSFSEEGSRLKDRLDAFELEPMGRTDKASIYSVLPDGNKLSINNLPREFGKPIKVPVGIGAGNRNPLEGDFTIAARQLDRLPEGWKITLKDEKTGNTQRLAAERSYSFSAGRGKAKAPDSAKAVDSLAKAGPQRGFKYRPGQPVVANTAKAEEARFVLLIEPGEENGEIPEEFALYDNYPNPFNPSTKIEFDVPVESKVRLEVYNIIGRRVATLVNKRLEAGQHQVEWRADNLSSGVYIYRLQSEGKQFTRKMTLVK